MFFYDLNLDVTVFGLASKKMTLKLINTLPIF